MDRWMDGQLDICSVFCLVRPALPPRSFHDYLIRKFFSPMSKAFSLHFRLSQVRGQLGSVYLGTVQSNPDCLRPKALQTKESARLPAPTLPHLAPHPPPQTHSEPEGA